MRKKLVLVGSCLAVALALATPARAGSFTFTSSSGTLSASATFTDSGGTLTVVLTNTSLSDVLVPADVLTALFFNCACGSLIETSAVLTSGSVAVFDTQPAGGVVGGEWAYGAGFSGGPGGATRAISSAGFGFFGGATFPGVDLDPPTAINGLNYGILSAGDINSTGNAAVTGSVPYVQNSVTFAFSGYTGGSVTSSTFSNISFQYGTALTEPNVGGGSGGGSGQQLVPEPASLLLFGSGLAMTALRARRKKKEQKTI